jgi:hypothetical protein
MEPEFVDPPLPGGNRRNDDKWAKTVSALVQRSGEWARIFAGDSGEAGSLAARIRKSRGAWEGHEWEATTRSAGRGRESCVHVYARHIRPLDTSNDEGDKQQ